MNLSPTLPARAPNWPDALLSFHPMAMVHDFADPNAHDWFLGMSGSESLFGTGREGYRSALDAARSYSTRTGYGVGVVRNDDGRYGASVLVLTSTPSVLDKLNAPLDSIAWSRDRFDMVANPKVRILNPVRELRAVVTPTATVTFSKYGNDIVHRRG